MSYTTPDLSDAVIAALCAAGYRLAKGNGHETTYKMDAELPAAPEPQDGDEASAGYDITLDGFWFTWAHPDGAGDVEVGPTVPTELQAWASAVSHATELARDAWLDREQVSNALRAVLPFAESRVEDLEEQEAQGVVNAELDAPSAIEARVTIEDARALLGETTPLAAGPRAGA